MVLPLVPVAIGAAAGIGGGMLAEGLLHSGDTKKGTTITNAQQYANTYHQPFETYQPTTLYAPQQQITMPSYLVSIGSSQSPQSNTTRQNATQDISQYPTYDQPTTYPNQSNSAGSSGFDSTTMLIVALIAAGGLVAYGVVK